HPDGRFLYVGADDAARSHALVHVVDIDASSPTFRQLLQTIRFADATSFRQIAPRPDGKRLYALVSVTSGASPLQALDEVDVDAESPTRGTVLQVRCIASGAVSPSMLCNHSGTSLFVHDPNNGREYAIPIVPVMGNTVSQLAVAPFTPGRGVL